MKLFKISVFNGFQHSERYILAEGYPGNKRAIKFLSMYAYCGHEMTDADYKEFVVDNGHILDWIIEDIETVEFITIPPKTEAK